MSLLSNATKAAESSAAQNAVPGSAQQVDVPGSAQQPASLPLSEMNVRSAALGSWCSVRPEGSNLHLHMGGEAKDGGNVWDHVGVRG